MNLINESHGCSEISPETLEYIFRSMENISYGQIILVAQNFRLIQIERNEKFRPMDLSKKNQQKIWEKSEKINLLRKIRLSFFNLEYGQLIISVKDGNVFQIERVEKQRFTGLNGEGI